MAVLTRPKRPTLPPGTVLDDRFELGPLLGAGSFGAVYQAKQLVFGKPLRTVALKLFEADRVNPGNVRDVFGDAVTLIGLHDESPDPEVTRRLIQVYDIGLVKSPQPRAFMSMKLVPGKKTLETAVRRWQAAKMPVATALSFLIELLTPLAWMHTRDVPVVHGDLKPDNVLLAEDDQTLILTDFGLAARLPLGSLGGAIAYQAPENLAGHPAEPPADVYAVGLIAYELLTGRQPFADADLEATAAGDGDHVRRHQAARKWPIRPARGGDDSPRIPPASEVNAELRAHPQLEAIVNRCLAEWQADRYPNARLLLADLLEYRASGAVVGLAAAPTAGRPTAAKASHTLADAEALLATRQFDAALAAVKSNPSTRARLVEVRAKFGLGHLQDAYALCHAARAAAPDDPDVCVILADVLDALKKPIQAAAQRKLADELRVKAATRRPGGA